MNLKGPLTHRQFLTWELWDREQWNQPSRTDHYLMQVACEVRRVLSSKPNKIKLSHFVLKFGQGRDTVDTEKAAERSKAIWFAHLRLDKDGKPLEGVKRQVIKTPPTTPQDPPRSAVQHPTSNIARNRK